MADNTTYRYSFEDIQRYLNGGMSAEEMHDMEKAALTDPFLADAIDGFSSAGTTVSSQHLNEITAAIHAHIPTAIVAPMKPAQRINWKKGAVAAVSLTVLGIAAWYFMNGPLEQSDNIADNTVLPTDSIKTQIVDSHSITTDTSTPFIEEAPSVAPVTVVPERKKSVAPSHQVQRENAPAVAEKSFADQQLDKAVNSQPVNTIDNLAIQQRKKEASNTQNRFFNRPNNNLDETTAALARQQETNTFSNNAANAALANQANNMLQKQAAAETVETLQINQGKMALKGQITNSPTNQQANQATNIAAARNFQNVNYLAKADANTINQSASPMGGWEHFLASVHYRLGASESLNNQTLHLKFDIQHGEPTNFMILDAPDESTAKKAIDIIKTGPKWKASKKTEKAEVKMTLD